MALQGCWLFAVPGRQRPELVLVMNKTYVVVAVASIPGKDRSYFGGYRSEALSHVQISRSIYLCNPKSAIYACTLLTQSHISAFRQYRLKSVKTVVQICSHEAHNLSVHGQLIYLAWAISKAAVLF
jgi:hypothetical protein